MECSIQKSSLATEDCIWLGVDHVDLKILASVAVSMGREDLLVGHGPERTTGWVDWPVPQGVTTSARMHLSQEQVRALLPLLQHFAETGELP